MNFLYAVYAIFMRAVVASRIDNSFGKVSNVYEMINLPKRLKLRPRLGVRGPQWFQAGTEVADG
jgi:hypothetical protein